MCLLRMLAVIIFAPCIASAAVNSAIDDAERRIEADVRFLASDLLEGREAGTRGYDLAATYVSERFRSLGLEPGTEDGYLQQVPLLRVSPKLPDWGQLSIRRAGKALPLEAGKDYLVGQSSTSTEEAVEAPLVFVGYGIYAPQLGRDDYSGVDVQGKIVVLLGNSDPSLPSEEAAHLGRNALVRASELGAVGGLRLQTPKAESIWPYAKSAKRFPEMSRMRWLDVAGKPHLLAPNLRGWASLNQDAAAKLFEGTGHSWESIIAASEKGALPSFELGASARIESRTVHKRLSSPNVVGVLPGSDRALRGEYVVISAHLDHVGIRDDHSAENDRLFNGAMDNASGIATMLEVARKLMVQPPKRSVIFLAVTAEEKGLVGSDYFAHNPTVPVPAIVANINIDMPVLTADFDEVVAFGAEHSNLKGLTARAAQRVGVKLVPDPMPEQVIFVRSDQYSFVKQGIPAIYLSTLGESEKSFLDEHYHEPSDEWGLIQYPAAAKFARLNYEIVSAVANSERQLAWNDGDFFGTLFANKEDRESASRLADKR